MQKKSWQLGVLLCVVFPTLAWGQPAPQPGKPDKPQLTPDTLRGEWDGDDGKLYTIAVQRALVLVQVPVKHSKVMSTYTGSFHPSQITLSSQPKGIEEIDPNLDAQVRKNLLNRPYIFKARLEVDAQNKLQLVKILDNVTYSAKTFAIKTIDENAGEEVIRLRKGGGYTLANPPVMEQTGYRRRLEAMLAELDRQIQLIRETQLAAAQADFQHHTEIWDAQRQRIQALKKQYNDNLATLQQAQQQLGAIKNSPAWKTQQELERAIQTIEEGILSGKESARLQEALKRLQDYQEALAKNRDVLEKEAKRFPQYQGLESKVKAALQDNDRLRTLLSQLYEQGEPFRLKALEALEKKEALENDIQQKERKKIFLQNSKPHVIGLLLTAGGEERYSATEEIDPLVLQQLDRESGHYQMGWNHSNKVLTMLQSQLTQDEALKNSLGQDFSTAKKDLLAVAAELNTVMQDGVTQHAAIDTVIEGGEVLLKSIQKGPLGGFMTAAFKTMENALTTDAVGKDDTFRLPLTRTYVRAPFGYLYKMYDESELQKQYYARAYLEEMAETGDISDEGGNYLTDELKQQWQKAPSTGLGTVADTVKDRKELREEITKYIQKLEASPEKWQAACQAMQGAQRDTLEKRAETLKELLEKEILEETQSLQAPRTVWKSLQSLKAKYAQFTLKDAIGSVTGLATDVAIDIVKDMAQTYLHNQVNANQQFKWEEFLEYDFRMMKAQRLYRQAITNYWNTREAIEAQHAFQEGMLALMLQTRKLQQRYLKAQDGCGLHVAKNIVFYAEEVPLTLRVTMTAPPDRTDVQEAVTLLPTELSNKPIKRLPGRPLGVSAPPPGVMQPLNQNTPASEGKPLLYESYHFFAFPAEQLKEMQKTGPLSLSIEQL